MLMQANEGLELCFETFTCELSRQTTGSEWRRVHKVKPNANNLTNSVSSN